MRTALDEYGQQIPEILPTRAPSTAQSLIDRQSAINEIHFPTSEVHRKAAQKRLAFEEFFLLSLGMEMKKEHRDLGGWYSVPSWHRNRGKCSDTVT